MNGATLAWLDPAAKIYHRIPVTEQAEVLSLIGDMSTFNGKPIVHMHAWCSAGIGTAPPSAVTCLKLGCESDIGSDCDCEHRTAWKESRTT